MISCVIGLALLAGGAKASPERLLEIAAAPSAQRLQSDVSQLAGFGTRHTLSETASDVRGIGAARRWIKSGFDEISAACGGCLEVYFQREVVQPQARVPEPTETLTLM